jgi:hypothetical protein
VERTVFERPAGDHERKTVSALQRHTARRAGVHDAGKRPKPVDAVPDQLLDGFGPLVVLSRQRHPHRQDVVRVEAGIDTGERDRRANQQSRSDEQNQRQRDFHDDENGARAIRSGAAARRARPRL